MPIVSHAQVFDTGSDGWPTEIDYPSGVYADPTGEKAEEILRNWPKQSEVDRAKLEKKYENKGWRRFNPFGKSREERKKGPPPTEESIVNVGPRQTHALGNPLLALPVPLQLNNTPAGFYLIYQEAMSPDQRKITLLRQSQTVVTLEMVKINGDNDLEPLEPVEPRQPTANRVTLDSKVSSDGRFLTIFLNDGQERFQSSPLPTLLDTRRELGY